MANLKEIEVKGTVYNLKDETARNLANPSTGTNGQVLTKTEDGTGWSDAGTPTDEQVDSAVSDWLENHPEATTTVQDGSITQKKLSAELSEAISEITGNILPQLEYGNIGISTNGWSYSASTTRVRTVEGYTMHLGVGSVIKLTDYSIARMYVGGHVANGYIAQGWITSDYTVTTEGDYVVLLDKTSTSIQVSDLFNMLVVTNTTTFDSRIQDITDELEILNEQVNPSYQIVFPISDFTEATEISGKGLNADGTIFENAGYSIFCYKRSELPDCFILWDRSATATQQKIAYSDDLETFTSTYTFGIGVAICLPPREYEYVCVSTRTHAPYFEVQHFTYLNVDYTEKYTFGEPLPIQKVYVYCETEQNNYVHFVMDNPYDRYNLFYTANETYTYATASHKIPLGTDAKIKDLQRGYDYFIMYKNNISYARTTFPSLGKVNKEKALQLKKSGQIGKNRYAVHNADNLLLLLKSSLISDWIDVDVSVTTDNKFVLLHDVITDDYDTWTSANPNYATLEDAIVLAKMFDFMLMPNFRTTEEQMYAILDEIYNRIGKGMIFGNDFTTSDKIEWLENQKYIPYFYTSKEATYSTLTRPKSTIFIGSGVIENSEPSLGQSEYVTVRRMTNGTTEYANSGYVMVESPDTIINAQLV